MLALIYAAMLKEISERNSRLREMAERNSQELLMDVRNAGFNNSLSALLLVLTVKPESLKQAICHICHGYAMQQGQMAPYTSDKHNETPETPPFSCHLQ